MNNNPRVKSRGLALAGFRPAHRSLPPCVAQATTESPFRRRWIALATALVLTAGVPLAQAATAATANVTPSTYRPYSAKASGFASSHINSDAIPSMLEVALDSNQLDGMKKMSPRALRYPGGTSGSYWDFQQGDGPFGPGYLMLEWGPTIPPGPRPGNTPEDFAALRDAVNPNPPTNTATSPAYFVVLNMVSQPNNPDIVPLPPASIANLETTIHTLWNDQLTYNAKMFSQSKGGFTGFIPGAQGLTVYVELGNEMYGGSMYDGNGDVYAVGTHERSLNDVYPDGLYNNAGTFYARASHFFITRLATRIIEQGGPNFHPGQGNTMKFGIVGMSWRYKQHDPAFNTKIKDFFATIPNTNEHPHAWIYHPYLDMKMSPDFSFGSYPNGNNTFQDTILTKVWTQMNEIQHAGPCNTSMYTVTDIGFTRYGGAPSRLGPNKGEIWFTEYNSLAPKDVLDELKGSWGHGLSVALMTLRFYDPARADVPANSNSILENLHTLMYSSISTTTPGSWNNSVALYSDGNLTSLGVAMALVNEAISNGQTVAPIVFPGITLGNPVGTPTNTLQNLYGVAFKGGAGTVRAVIVNTSSTPYSVNFGTGFTSGGFYKQIAPTLTWKHNVDPDAIGITILQPISRTGNDAVTCPAYSLTMVSF